MTLEQLAYIGELVAALSVVLSLVYLARQVTQNNKLLAAQARYNLIALRADIASSITNPYILEALHKYAAGEDLSAAEKSAALTTAVRNNLERGCIVSVLFQVRVPWSARAWFGSDHGPNCQGSIPRDWATARISSARRASSSWSLTGRKRDEAP